MHWEMHTYRIWSLSIPVKLLQAGTGGHTSRYQHESGCSLGQRALRCDRTSQMAVWRVVTWRHSSQSYGVRRRSGVRNVSFYKHSGFGLYCFKEVYLLFPLFLRRVHITEATLKHLNKAYEVEEGNGHLRDPYLKELNIQTYLVIDPRVSPESLFLGKTHIVKDGAKSTACKTSTHSDNRWRRG